MNYLWNFVNRFCPESTASGIFLTMNIVCWTTGTFLAGLLFWIVIGHAALIDCIASLMCVAIYAGIIFGLFGGILYLMRALR